LLSASLMMVLNASRLSRINSCQWLFARYAMTGTSIGKAIYLKCLRIFRKNSFSKKHIVLSATDRWGEAIHFTIRLNIAGARGSNLFISQHTSKMSNNSERKSVYLE